ncbi:hypothetical protein ACWFR1_11620 [Streptomyces sp. NPDC055103]
MMWLDLLVAYGHAVDVVVSTAHVWAPVLLGAASLGWGVRRTGGRRRHRRTWRPGTSGHDADTPPDIAVQVPLSQP